MKNVLTITFATLFIAFINPMFAGCKYESALNSQQMEMGVFLEWSTVLEENNHLFIVERSETGAEWESIGLVKGQGTTTEKQTYRFFDANVNTGRFYYRLKQMDYDGKANVHRTVVVDKETSNAFQITEMSSTTNIEEELTVALGATEERTIRYEVQAMNGTVIKTKEIVLKEGTTELNISFEDFKAANYKVLFTDGDEMEEVLVTKK